MEKTFSAQIQFRSPKGSELTHCINSSVMNFLIPLAKHKSPVFLQGAVMSVLFILPPTQRYTLIVAVLLEYTAQKDKHSFLIERIIFFESYLLN